MPKEPGPKSYLEIDTHNLDQELLVQPRMAREWAKRLAEATFAVNDAEATLELVKAKVKLDIRDHPAKYGFEKKPTDDAVKDKVVTTESYQAAQRTVNEAKRIRDLVGSNVKGVSARKYTLEVLWEMYLTGYFGEPRPQTKMSREALQDRSRRKIREGVRSRGGDGVDDSD